MLVVVEKPRLLARCQGFGRRLLAERQLILRSEGRMRYISLNRFCQIGITVVLFAIGGWIGFATVGYLDLKQALIDKSAEVARGQQAYRDLLADIANTRQRFASITGALENNHQHLLELLDQNRTLKGDVADLQAKLKAAEAKRPGQAIAPSDRADLERKVSQLEERLESVVKGSASLHRELSVTDSRLTGAAGGDRTVAARTKTDVMSGPSVSVTINRTTDQKSPEPTDPKAPGSKAEGERQVAAARDGDVDGRVNKLEARLAELRRSQDNLVSRISVKTTGDIERAREMLASVDLDLDAFLARQERKSKKTAQGGPFIAVANAGTGDSFQDSLATLSGQIEQWERIQDVLRHLPFAAPVKNYGLSSRFGRRHDPINNRIAVHRGLDLRGKWGGGDEIASAAAGVVRSAGWMGKYGRMIEIDHGNGVRTRYGHLRKIEVKRGQRIEQGETIGVLGSSGRSTGPHVHFEVLVNGRYVDPERFLLAGKNVLKG
jgi:murein DD-endopeptidase MepM/ murein hydrolase activator NlpD